MLTIKNLQVSYGSLDVLTGVNLSVNAGECCGIVGLNGAGKTTFFNAIYGSVSKNEGEVRLNAEKVGKSLITFLETSQFFYSRITGKEYLNLFKVNNPEFDIKGWNKVFELPLNKLVETYSTGMKKKLALMGVLSIDNPVYLLDEPFNGLDLETNQKVRSIIDILREQGKIILVSSHILETLTTSCDYIAYLNKGVIEFTAHKHEYIGLDQRIFKNIDMEGLRELLNK